MKIIVLLSALLSVSFAVDTELYTTADDHFDIKALVEDKERLKAYVECFTDKGPCDKTSQSYKDLAQEAITTACLKCNDDQKHMANIYFSDLKIKNPTYYNDFFLKYDPEGKYEENFIKAIKDF